MAADYHPEFNTGATVRQYGYAYDLAGNRTQKSVDGVTTDYIYNALDQLITANDGTTETFYGYDANGNLTTTGVEITHTWDRANRLVSHGGSEYAYNGAGQRVSQTVDDVVTNYLLDVQPELWTIIGATSAGDTVHYLHGPMGIERQQQPDDSWIYPVSDALGSVRGVVDDGLSPLESRQYAPYGEVFASAGTAQTAYGFTGEPSDANGLLHLRARYYESERGRFMTMDPSWRESNLYGYSYSNPIVYSDPTGLQGYDPNTPTGFGTIVHRMIQQHYVKQLGTVDTQLEWPIPLGSVNTLRPVTDSESGLQVWEFKDGNNRGERVSGNADIVDFGFGMLYEIKPDNPQGIELGYATAAISVL